MSDEWLTQEYGYKIYQVVGEEGEDEHGWYQEVFGYLIIDEKQKKKFSEKRIHKSIKKFLDEDYKLSKIDYLNNQILCTEDKNN